MIRALFLMHARRYTMGMNYEVIIVLGSGVNRDGSLPASAESNVRKAVEMYNQESPKPIIFSGRWWYGEEAELPCTEAEAMSRYAGILGVPESDRLEETQADTTVANLYYVKENFLLKNGWRTVLIVTTLPHVERARLNAWMVLGDDYVIDVVASESVYAPETLVALQAVEAAKLPLAKDFFAEFKPGDHLRIFNKTREALKNTRN